MAAQVHGAETMGLVVLTDLALVPKNSFGTDAVDDARMGVKFEAVLPKKPGIVF